jgi:hypothetical protein
MTVLDKIKDLIKHLPSRDIDLANSFIDKRNFESLLELINSDIILVEVNSNAAVSNPMYEVDLNQLVVLQELVVAYFEGTQVPKLDELEDEY